jgi:electron transfer flavoprotein alpha subunit
LRSALVKELSRIWQGSCIIATNKDPAAPIFNLATFSIVGDLFEIVPALTKKLKEGA